MVKKFNDYPRLFGEELYLCNEFGRVLTGRGGAGRDLKNAFSLIPREEFYFIKEHMAFAGFCSMILVDSEIGPLLFDLSLSPKFNFIMLIIPHFSAREVLELARGELSMRITPSPRIMAMM